MSYSSHEILFLFQLKYTLLFELLLFDIFHDQQATFKQIVLTARHSLF